MMRFFSCVPLLFSFFTFLSYALEVSNFQFFPTDDPTGDIFPLEEYFDDTFAWDGTFDEISDSPFLLASDCSIFSPSIDRKRIRRGDSSGVCSSSDAPGGSTDHEGQQGENGHSSTGSSDGSIEPNIPLGNLLSIPALATYHNDRNIDCFRLTQGQLPLAVCGLDGGREYTLDGQRYRDLDISYPSKAMHHFPVYHLLFINTFLLSGGFKRDSTIPF